MSNKKETKKEIFPAIDFDKKEEKKIATKIMEFLNREIFDKLKLNENAPLENSEKILIDAIKKGKIQIINNVVYGQVNSKIVKELKKHGAFIDPKSKKLRVDITDFKVDVLEAIFSARSRFRQLGEKFAVVVDELDPNFDDLKLDDNYNKVIDHIDKKFTETLKDGIAVEPKFTKDRKERIAEKYTNNMRLNIKDWLDKEVVELREAVKGFFERGERYDFLVDFIRKKKDISLRKAKFLAKQETNLISSEYRQSRYEEAGVKYYQWSTSGLPTVRESHKVMNRKFCKFDDPTVYADSLKAVKEGKWKSRRNIGGVELHPQQDYNCNCMAKPVLLEDLD